MLIGLLEVRKTKDMGKGLFAKKTIPKGTIVCFVCKGCKKISGAELGKMPPKKREFITDHAWRDKDGKLVMQCSNAIYFNHSCNANVLDSGKGFDIAVRTIKNGEQATYDYRSFYEKKGDSMPCRCGERNCCKIIRWRHPVPKPLRDFWQRKINSALKAARKVDQPLRDDLLKMSDKYRKFLV
jgi:SET domain-containing protein